MERLDRETILRALEELSRALESAGVAADLALVGGAPLVLLFGVRESTKDVDAIILSPSETAAVRAAALTVAEKLGLPSDWLNDGAKGYVHGLELGARIFDSRSLHVHALSVAQLLAMKLSAWRDEVDISDARTLLAHCGSGTKDAVWASVEGHLVRGRELKAQYAFEDLWEATHGTG